MHRRISAEQIDALPLFAGMAEEEKRAFLQQGRERKLQRGQRLFSHGDPVSHFYLITSGVIQLCRTTPEGHAKTLDVLKPGQTIGEGEIMDACNGHRVDAMAVEDTTLLEFPVQCLKQTAQQNGTFALNLLALIAGQAHMAQLEAEHQASMNAAQLVACFLQRLCILYDFNPKGFELPYSKTLIASRLGMELETFSRTLTKLKEHGITVTGTQVAIHDFARIEAYACGFCSVAGDCPTHQAMAAKLT